MRELLVASGNRGKILEIGKALGGCVDRILSAADCPGLPPVIEDGATFEDNALKKALSAALASGIPALADDSGLVVEALGGRPGVFSARYAGEGAGDAENNEKLLRELNGIPEEQRHASFHCVAALCLPDGTCSTFTGELHGIILAEPRGNGGFGYDPLFLVPGYGKTLAELSLDIKNGISHRGKALEKLRKFLSHG